MNFLLERLPDFQQFLISNRFVVQKQAPFYSLWVCKFLSFSNQNQKINVDLRVRKFILDLQNKKKFTDWQIQQAQHAVNLYIHHFLKKDSIILSPNLAVQSMDKNFQSILNQMREVIRLKQYAYRTEKSYLNWVKRFYHYGWVIKKRSFDRQNLGVDDVRKFLSFLAIRKNVSSSTQNQAFNALLFLYHNVLHIDLTHLGKIVRAKRGPKMPVVLTIAEVTEIFKHLQGKTLLMLQLLYGAGLRITELISLRVKDVDFENDAIFVRSGKGDKDRMTLFPSFVKKDIKVHLDEVKKLHEKDLAAGLGEVYLPNALERKYPNSAKEWKWQYIFPSANLSTDPRSGKVGRFHISEKALRGPFKIAVKRAGINKLASVHTLRHSFATHLLMDGTNVRMVQDLLGHKKLETTMIYTHVARNMTDAPQSPLDKIYLPKSTKAEK